MNSLDVTIRRAETPVREASAWLLCGSETAWWLEEIARWGLADAAQNALTLYVLPRELGVLVALPPETPLALSPAGAAYGRIGLRLFLPVDALLEPSMSLDDLEILLRHDVSIAHPSFGWVGFEHEQALRLSDLITFPSISAGRWRKPSAGSTWNPRIVSVSLATAVSFEAFFEEEQRDISSQSIDEIPAPRDEPGPGLLRNLKRRTLEPLARGARALSRHVSGRSSSPTWVNRLEDWANDQLRTVSRELENLRNLELHRLLNLLDTDAEKGLQHALPLGGGAHRGLASAGGQLGARRVDFELASLGGGQPLDPWDVPFEIQQKLLAKYRELANRERRLGRFRRAAYIYAELMGDLETAAAVLKEGKHFREAAEVYRRHLHNSLMAAKTYEAGGHFREALEIYEELAMWEEVGDACIRMEQPAKARLAFERARDERLAASDRLGASRIAETKLDDVDHALAIVEEGWPDSHQAGDCLKRQIAIQAREGLHARTETLLKRLGAETPPHLIGSLVSCLAAAATSYPNARVRHDAADLSRRKISARLGLASRDEAVRLLENLYRLAPEDLLLERDGARYLGTKPHRRVAPRRRRGVSPKPELVRSFALPNGVRWFDVKSAGNLYFALGHERDELKLYRGNLGGRFELLSWPLDLSEEEASTRGSAPVTMDLDATGHRCVILRHAFFRELRPQIFSSSREVLEAETVAGDPGWLPRGTLALSNLSRTWVALRYHAERLVISTYDTDGAHLADVADWTRPEEAVHLTLACQNQFIVVGQTWERWSGELLVFDTLQQALAGVSPALLTPQRYKTRSGILGLRVAQPHTRSRVAVRMFEGVALRWLDRNDSYVVASDLEEPSVGMLRNGAMIVVSGRTVRVYRTDEEEAELTTEMELPPQFEPAIDVVSGYAPNQFGIFTAGGQMAVYALSSG